ncbi:chalcone isomerase family protein [Shewanella sp. JM162201]|uniref:Chalcone isomerase family protein n=1 Tax=Shewanella jiangmenensis TaxID=2837387 RepID=A0ABS5V1U7_9GAMM|nr:chalcone isomerase family protein [Shewanella jiangmenensis]MBT1444442.1 chalcone isomerase family protein [Shewanella jiangmenensis]
MAKKLIAARTGSILSSLTIALALLLSACLITPRAFAAPLDGLSRIGKGKMDWLWLELYQASLYSADGRYEAGRFPLALEIRYSRDIKASDLLDATEGEWQKQGLAQADIKRHLALLKSVWVNVKTGDTLLLVATNSNQGEFFHNGQSLGVVEQADIMQAFLGIWLRSDTSEPTLRAQLLGEASCDC